MGRNTIQRTIVYNTVTGMRNHPSADMVYEEVARDYPGIGRATVFRLLNSLAEEGMVQKLCMSTTADRFDFTLHPHPHKVCSACGAVSDYPHDISLGVPDDCDDFEIKHMDVIFRGLCKDCK
ncbi:MAG: transcriptional repressor [Clostridia bacterium]|nr:transcriptional repressor [Clostridia bacterium]